ncbi:transposase [Holospora curviuscula]|nr:transposase [Holospora curviuscula]
MEGQSLYQKNGCFWRDIPKKFGPWKSVLNDFNRLKHREHLSIDG